MGSDLHMLIHVSIILACLCFGFSAVADLQRKTRLITGFLVFVYVVFYGVYEVSDYFTGAGINEAVIYHLTYGLSGAGFSEYRAVITDAVLLCLLGFFLWGAICHSRLKVAGVSGLKRKGTYALLLACSALALNPVALDAYRIYGYGTTIDADRPFSKYYRSGQVDAARAKRNFVFLYLESLEQNYLNETLFPGLTPQLKKLQAESVTFSEVGQTVGSGWTIAGMVATQCGLPLFAGNSMTGMDSFLPGAVCLGDVLVSTGYRLEYFGGAELAFAGKGDFLLSHHFQKSNGLAELLPKVKNPDDTSGWGLYDDVLFEIAFDRFEELAGTGEPFGLFLLTLDTHHPNGLPSPSCNELKYADGSNLMLNAVACSDRLAGRFVERIRKSRYGRDTVIFIVSDHLAMRNSATERLDDAPRNNLVMVLDPAEEQPRNIVQKGTTLDVATTLLPFLGLRGTIGLGRDLSAGSSLAMEIPDLNAQLLAWQPEVRKLWSFPELAGQFRVDAVSKRMQVNGRTFAVPALVVVDSGMQTEFFFGSSEARHKNALLEQVSRFDPVTPFLWVDDCALTSKVSSRRYEGGLCVALGRLSANPDRRTIHGRVVPVNQSFVMESDEIKRIFQ